MVYSPSSPPLKKIKESESEKDRSLFILCSEDRRYMIHEILIGEDGMVKGKPFDDLPVCTELFKAERDVFWVNSTNLGSTIYMTAASSQDENIFKTLIFDAKDRSLCSGGDLYNANPLKQKFRENYTRSPCCLLISACGKIYALVVPSDIFDNDSSFSSCKKSSAACGLFECFDPSRGTWESLSPPPLVASPTGYVVVEQHHLILVCFVGHHQDSSYVMFYSFNLLTLQWNRVSVCLLGPFGKHACVTRDPYNPHYRSDSGFNLVPYPIYGRAEFVDGITYSCMLRSIVTYRLIVDSDTGCVPLQDMALHFRAHYHSTFIDFENAPAFKDAPFGLPCFGLRRLSHLGNNVFCMVETAQELQDYESFAFQPIYITTFHLNVSHGPELIQILHSTIRLVDVRTHHRPDVRLLFCFSPLHLPLGYNQHLALPSTASLCQDFKEYIHSRIPKFCEVFINHMDEMFPYASMLFSKMKHEIEMFKNPIVRYFFQYMTWMLNDGPRPDPFLLLDKKSKELMIQSPRSHDVVECLDCDKSIFIVSLFGGKMCGLHEIKILKGGVVAGNLIPLKTEVERHKSTFFDIGCSVNLSNDVYFFLLKFPELRGDAPTIVHYSVVNVENYSRLEKMTKPAAPKEHLTVFGNDSKIYALSGPSEFPDSIPKPAFECFDPVLGLWKLLQPAPFHSMSMEAEIRGYAIVDDYILISLNNEFEFYSYNIHRDEWQPVLKPETKESDTYRAFNGKAEYMDRKVYVYLRDGFVLEFLLMKDGDNFCIYPPTQLGRLDIVFPVVRWDRKFSGFMVHLGHQVFCAIDTGDRSRSDSCQYARITTFTILKPGHLQTLHSTLCVLDTKNHGWADILHCFSV